MLMLCSTPAIVLKYFDLPPAALAAIGSID